jgi:Kef-type K+ transport system membrane component KefB
VLSDASKDADFTQSKVGTVLLSAAVIDDVSGLVMARYDSYSKYIP